MTKEQIDALKHILHIAEEYCDEYNLYRANEEEITIVENFIKEQDEEN